MKQLFLILIFGLILLSQEKNNDVRIKTFSLNDTTLNLIIENAFSNILRSKSRSNIGNYASLNLSDPNASFSSSTLLSNFNILGYKIDAGYANESFKLFTKEELNANVSIEINYHILVGNKQINFLSDMYLDYELKKSELIVKKNNDLNLIRNGIKRKAEQKNLSKIKSEIENHNKQIDNEDDIEKKYKLIKVRNLKIVEQNKISKTLEYNDRDLANKINQFYNESLKKLNDESLKKNMSYNLNWFSFGLKLSAQKFKYFDSSLVFDNQIDSKISDEYKVYLQFSSYNKSRIIRKSVYWTLGFSYAITDNFNELTKKELKEKVNYTLNDNERYSNTTKTVYEGTFKKEINTYTIYSDYYRFITKNNTGAFHFYPEVIIKESIHTKINIGIGFMQTFIDEKTNDNFINAEVFIDLIDVTNKDKSDKNVFYRSEIGLRFSIPIKFEE